MLKLLRVVIFTLLVILLISVSFFAGFGTATHFDFVSTSAENSTDVQARFKIFWQAWDVVHREYIDRKNLDDEAMTRGAINGMVQSLGDAHTVYIEPKYHEYEKEEFGATFGGIGATVTIRDSHLTVVAPIADSPAELAGIRSGDRILRIDGEDTQNMTLVEAVSKIRGEKGTKVKLLIVHDDSTTSLEIEIIRGDIKTVSVYVDKLPDSIAVLRITHFSERTDEEVKEQLQDLLKSDLKGIIIDLRDNPGGYLHITVNTASQFLKDGVVCYEEDSEGKRTEWRVRPGGLATDVPLAVLVNKGSASGSEILAGALQDLGRAPLIGEETFGKGSAQRQYEFSDGSAIAVTVSRWLTSKGRQIEGKGLSPDIEVKMTVDDYKANGDIQLNRAVEYLKTGK